MSAGVGREARETAAPARYAAGSARHACDRKPHFIACAAAFSYTTATSTSRHAIVWCRVAGTANPSTLPARCYISPKNTSLTILRSHKPYRHPPSAITTSQRRQHNIQKERQKLSQSTHTVTLNTKRLTIKDSETKRAISTATRATSKLSTNLGRLAKR
jgi:hypothetical protein